jgi:nucleotide-binding universal stress UspA family protein
VNYKDLLVHVDDTKACGERIEAALKLAQKWDAHLTGVITVPEPVVPAFVQAGYSPDIIEMQETALEEVVERLSSDFDTRCNKAGIRAERTVARGAALRLADELSLRARHVDLAILGQPDTEESDVASQTVIIEQVLMGGGRPCLIIPYIGLKEPFGERILVGWDGGREACRAVHDAMPLLSAAKSVFVLSVNPEERRHSGEPGADIGLHLARHDVKVEVEHITGSEIAVADAMLSHVADRDIDLIVMGGYGHSRLRELILGGVTREILRHMTVPALMSH